MAFKIVLITCLLAHAISAQQKSITTSKQNGIRTSHYSGELIFEDNFDTLDFDKWEHEITMSGGGNWEFEIYWNNRTNSYVKDGVLYIKPNLVSDRFGEEFLTGGRMDLWGGSPADQCTMNAFWGCERSGANGVLNPVSSARLRTSSSFAFTYGKVEVKAQLPSGDWLWPAIWMLPLKQEYGIWPTSGEIDIMESRGNNNLMKNGVNIGSEQYGATMHFGVDYIANGWKYATVSHNSAPGNGWHKDFHIYGMEWTPDYIKYTFDGQEIKTINVPAGGFWELGNFGNDYGSDMKNPWEGYAKNAPFDKDFYLIMNVAVGGTNSYFPDDATNPDPKPWRNDGGNAFADFWNAKDKWWSNWGNGAESSAMKVDYVRVYAL